ncbi:MAG: VOC family protein [Clostridiales bacterium]|jgi:predicted enzyme related to lactoylglutathione lyase|nr:VOC family protein [Clostridiales bacterium]
MRYANRICLITEDVRKLTAFYQKILQIKTEINDIHVEITLDGGGLTIYSKSAAEKDMGFDFSKYHGTGMTKITFIVENVDAEYERIKSLNMGIEFAAVPTTYPWGARSMHFWDLDGNIVCFVNC